MSKEDNRIITTAKNLFADGYINNTTFLLLKFDIYGVIDDTLFPVDICDNGDVYLRGLGAYPIVLHNYAS